MISIEALADALLTYEAHACGLASDVQILPAYIKEALRRVAMACEVYVDLHSHRKLSRKPISPKALVKGSNTEVTL